VIPKFESNLSRLTEYKETYGTVQVLAAHCRDGKFKGLDLFLHDWRTRANSYKQGRTKKSDTSEASMRRLVNLGVDLERTQEGSSSKFDWNFSRLIEYKETYGTVQIQAAHCRDGKFKGLDLFLHDWRSRVHSFKQGRAKKSNASEASVRRLINLGVDLERAMAGSSLEFEENFSRLTEYKETYDTAQVLAAHCRVGKFKGLDLFLHDWRSRASRFKQGQTKKTNSSAASMRRLINLGVDLERTPDGASQSKFERNFSRLTEYKEIHGTTKVKVAHCREEKFKGLEIFSKNWRSRVKRFEQGGPKESSASQEKIHQLIALGVNPGTAGES
jgi:hypothetical protein